RFVRSVGRDARPQAVGTGRQQYVLGPTAVDPGGGRKIVPLLSVHTKPGRPPAQRPSCPPVPAERGWRAPPDTRRAVARSCTGSGTSPAVRHARAVPDRRNAG